MKNEVQDMDILKSLVLDRERRAELSHAIAGVLYYKIDTGTSTYMFPVDMNDKADVGTATFNASEKAVTLMRYIRKAITNDALMRVK